jgi:hypothetical protein
MTRRVVLTFFGSPRRSVVSAVALCLAAAILYGVVPAAREVAAVLAVPVVAIGSLAFKWPNESKQLVGRLLANLTFLGGPVERESIRQDVEGTLSAGLIALARATPSAQYGKVRLQFLRSGDQIDKLPDGTLVVGIAPHGDRTRNLVAAAWVFSQNAVIPHARQHLDTDVSRGLDFAVTKFILSRADVTAVTEFIRSYWLPEIRDRDRLRDLSHMLEVLEEDALLGPVLIEEFGDLGDRWANRYPQADVAEESAAFVEHLYRLARGEVIPGGPNFEGDHIRAAFILMATQDVMAAKGEVAYRDALERCIRSAYPRIYVVARGAHVKHARAVCASLRDDVRVRAVREYECMVAGDRGNRIPRIVTQVVVDVRTYVGIGQRPIVAVGPGYTAAKARKRQGSRPA